MKIAEYALKNSRPINVLRVFLAILGVYFLLSLPREQYPDIPLYYVYITIQYPGASALDVEKEVTQKVESSIKSLSNVEEIQSMVSDSLSYTSVAYKNTLTKSQFKNSFLELQSVINNIDFNKDVLTPRVDEYTYLDIMPITNIVVYAKDKSVGLNTLMSDANIVKENLEIDPSIKNIEHRGLLKKNIRISLDKDELEKYNISLYEVQQAIAHNNVVVPAGILKTNNFFINVRTDESPTDIQGIGELLIRNSPTTILLKDIATIEYYYDNSLERIRYNGNDAVIFSVFKKSEADSITLVKKLEDAIDGLSNKIDSQVDLALFSDTTFGIQNSIKVLSSNVLIGFVLLLISLLVFLGWKPALISAFEIPFTFATSFFVLKLFGITLNTSTLFALVLVIGMIVDHSIVILENIIRLRCFYNYNRLNSILESLKQVGVPVISSSLTTIGTFLPLAFLPGLVGKFLLPIPVTITVALIISTISALIIIPIHYTELPGNERACELKIFIFGRKILEKVLTKLLKYSVIVCVFSLIIAGVSIYTLFNVPVSLYDTDEQDFFFVDIDLPLGTSMVKSDELATKIETSLLPLVDDGTIKSILTAIGNITPDPVDGIRIDKPNNVQFQIDAFNAIHENHRDLEDVIARVEEKMLQSPELSRITYRIRKQRTGPPSSSAVEFRVKGNNLSELEEIDKSIQRNLQKYTELYNIKSNFTLDKPELIIDIDEEKARSYGYNADAIGLFVRQWINKDAESSIFVDNKKNNIVIDIPNITESKLEDLTFINFPSTTSQELISLDKVASITRVNTLDTIYRIDGMRLIKISADAESQDRIKEINRDIEDLFNTTLASRYPETIFKVGGEFDEFENLLDDLLLLLLIGVFIVYIILVAEFKSYGQPLLILLTVLFTTIGVCAYLLIARQPLSIIVMYSFIALIGVVVNGSIVLVSTANYIQKETGESHLQSIKKASLQRFKPILLTNFTTILGVLPTALGLSGKSPIWQPMATTIATGLVFSTLTTLLIIPCFYALISYKLNKRHFYDYIQS